MHISRATCREREPGTRAERWHFGKNGSAPPPPSLPLATGFRPPRGLAPAGSLQERDSNLFPLPPLPCMTLTSHPSSLFVHHSGERITKTRRGKREEKARHWSHPPTHDTGHPPSEHRAHRELGGTNLTEALTLRESPAPSLSQQQTPHLFPSPPTTSFSTHPTTSTQGGSCLPACQERGSPGPRSRRESHLPRKTGTGKAFPPPFYRHPN